MRPIKYSNKIKRKVDTGSQQVPDSIAPSSWNWRLNFVVQNSSNALCVVKSQNGMVKNDFFTIYKVPFEIFTH